MWSRADQTVEGADYYAALAPAGCVVRAEVPGHRAGSPAGRRGHRHAAGTGRRRRPCRPAPGAGRQLPPGPRSGHAGRTATSTYVDGDAYLPVAVERWHVDRCVRSLSRGRRADRRRTRPSDGIEGSDDPSRKRPEVIGDVAPVRRRRRPRRLTRRASTSCRAPRTALRRGHGAVGRLDLSPAVGRRRRCRRRSAAAARGPLARRRRRASRPALADAIAARGGTAESIDPLLGPAPTSGAPSAPGSMRAPTGSSSR